jgi:hypothetical protein
MFYTKILLPWQRTGTYLVITIFLYPRPFVFLKKNQIIRSGARITKTTRVNAYVVTT